MHKILIALAFVCLAVRAETIATVDVDGIAVPLRATSVLAEDVLDADQAVARARLDYTPARKASSSLTPTTAKLPARSRAAISAARSAKPLTVAPWCRISGRTPPRSEAHPMR